MYTETRLVYLLAHFGTQTHGRTHIYLITLTLQKYTIYTGLFLMIYNFRPTEGKVRFDCNLF